MSLTPNTPFLRATLALFAALDGESSRPEDKAFYSGRLLEATAELPPSAVYADGGFELGTVVSHV